jgi:hypothetical protein
MEIDDDLVISPSTPAGAEEETVIEEHVGAAMCALFERGLSKSAIAERLGLHRATVRKYLSRPWAPQRRRRPPRPLDAFDDFLRRRAPEVGFNAKVLWRELQAQGYQGSYSPVALRILRLDGDAI